MKKLPADLQAEFIHYHAARAIVVDGSSICHANFITIKAMK